MCCFTGTEVVRVSRTRIFARASSLGDGTRQMLVYGMTLTASEDVAMILPLPVRRGANEDPLRFISLEGYPDIFDAIDGGFPIRMSSVMDSCSTVVPETEGRLAVHDVGLFEASFAPSITALSRLHPRFRLSDAVWAKLPSYAAHAFAIFRLKGFDGIVPDAASRLSAVETKTIHPMAFEFEREDASALFFPTVHVHDGDVHPFADFDHTLYAQAHSSVVSPVRGRGMKKRPVSALGAWQRSTKLASHFVALDKAQGIIDGELFCFRTTLGGTRANEDTRISI
jgi:hypothetical protein